MSFIPSGTIDAVVPCPQPVASIVVPIYNDQGRVETVVSSLMVQDLENYEIIFVDDCSTDRTPELLRRYESIGAIRLLKSPSNRGSGFCRNLGWQGAGSEVVAFTDSDCRAEPSWLRTIVEPVLRGRADAAMGPNHLCLRDSRACRLESVRAKQYRGMDTKNMAIRRGVLLELGGFREDIKVNVDSEFNARFGKSNYRVEYVEARVFHDFPDDVMGTLLKCRKRGRQESILLVSHRGLNSLRLVASRVLSKLRRLGGIWSEGSDFPESLAMVTYYLAFHSCWNGSLLASLLLPARSPGQRICSQPCGQDH